MSGDLDTSTHQRTRASKPLTPEQRLKKQQKFLKAYSEVAIIKHACNVAGIHRSTYYNWKHSDPDFAAQIPEADDEANDSLEYTAYEEGMIGVEEPLTSMGKPVYEQIPALDEKTRKPILDKQGRPTYKQGKMIMVRRRNPQVLITLLKARMPEKYRERPPQVNVKNEVNIGEHKERLLEKLRRIAPSEEHKEETPLESEQA